MTCHDNVTHSGCHCFSWKPVVAGALIAIGLTFLLNLFSVAIGLTAFTTNSNGVESLALGGLVGMGLGMIASMFAAGWMSGYLGQHYCNHRHLGALYGFLAWCLALIATIFLAGHIHDYVTFYAHFISGTEDVVRVSATSAGNATVTGAVGEKTLVVSTYIIFCLFFLSAFACCLGGHCGMNHVCKKEGTC